MARDKSRFRNNPRREALIGTVIFFVFVITFGAVLYYHIKTMRQSYAALDWKTCPVVKVEKKSPASNKGKGKTCCHYVYEGQSYQTETMGWGGTKSRQSLKNGLVHVNPAKPSEAVISPGGSTGAWIVLGILVPVVLALMTGAILSAIYYVRNYAGKPWVVQKVRRVDAGGARCCRWDRWSSLDELLDALESSTGKDEVATIENELGEMDGVEIISVEGGEFQLLVPEDAEWNDSLASPSMSRKNVVLWMEAYQLGVPVGKLTEGWEEL